MPNQESSRHAADTFFPVSSSAMLYGSRERVARPAPPRVRGQKSSWSGCSLGAVQ